MSTPIPCINPNPDIAGIGVRVSVYIQAFLNLLCALIFAKDGRISNYENTILTRTSTNLFITGSALLLAAFIQAGTIRFSVYHALIILNLSWVNTLSAVLYLILGAVNWCLTEGSGIGCGPVYEKDDDAESKSVLYPSIAHISGMGAFGIFVWSKINTFGNERQCTAQTLLTLFGHNIPVTNKSLRRASLAVYSIAAFPFVNIAVIVVIGVGVSAILYQFFLWISSALGLKGTAEVRNRNRFMLIMGLIIIAFLEVLFIVDTELMISRNRESVKPGESEWSFGQTLAMVITIIPFIDTAKAAYKSWNEPGRRIWLGNKPREIDFD